MIDQTTQPLYAVYLLHWNDGQGRAEHYVGITRHARVHARCREHATGQGASKTAALGRSGTPFDLARIFTTYNPQLEQTLIRIGARLRFVCPICKGEKPLSSYRPTQRATGTLPPLSSAHGLIAIATKGEAK